MHWKQLFINVNNGLIMILIIRDCREMLKIVFDFYNELIDKVIEIS